MNLHGTALVNRLKSGPAVLTCITRWALRRFDAIIVVNSHILGALERHVQPKHVDILPAYLEPSDDQYPHDETLESFLSSGTTLLAPVYGVQFLVDGRDLHGLDTVVEAFAALALQPPDLRLAFFVANRPAGRKSPEYLSHLTGRVEQSGLGDRMMGVFGISLTPAFPHDVILVRSTRSEGDAALSICEALAADVPVVASDVVDRPSGTTTFRANDVNDLHRAILETLDGPRMVGERPEGVLGNGSGEQLLERLLQVYRSQLRSPPSAGQPS